MKNMQEKVKKFCKENNMESPLEHRVLDLVSEIGEVSKEVLKMSEYGRKPAVFREEIKDELGDVLFSLIAVANTLNIDLEESLESALKKYNKRLERGSAGSESED